MTATARITTADRDNVCWCRTRPCVSRRRRRRRRRRRQHRGAPDAATAVQKPATPERPKWHAAGVAARDGQQVAIAVQTGASSGRQTEIVGGELKAGMAVITEQETKK